MTRTGTTEGSEPLPREIADGIFWLGRCLEVTYQGRPLHSYNAVYLVTGERCSVLIEGGHPQDLPAIERQLDGLLLDGVPELLYLFTTHAEPPHSSGFGRLLDRYPDTIACGDVTDMHLVFPEAKHRLRALELGDSLDLGGTELVVVEAVLRDLPSTRWAFDTRRRVLFAGDGFAYSHYHAAGQCGKTAEEAGSLDLADMTALFAELALFWTRFADLTPYVERLDNLVFGELRVELIAPTHGLPITDVETTLPKIREGLSLGSSGARGRVL